MQSCTWIYTGLKAVFTSKAFITERQTESQIERQIERQTERQTGRDARQTDSNRCLYARTKAKHQHIDDRYIEKIEIDKKIDR